MLSLVQVAASGVALAFGAWWALLGILALPRPRVGTYSALPLRWAVIIPAHNEEALIGETVASLRAAGAARDELLVVADNCSDATAAAAAAAGATVVVRNAPAHRGKSFALNFGLAWLRERAPEPDAVLFVDADTLVSPGIFNGMAERLYGGCDVVQAHYEGAKGDTAVSRLRRLALSLVHWTRPLGASRLGLPTTLKGNGMAFRWSVIRDGFHGSGITEDAAETLALLQQGYVVAFEPRATVTGRMATTLGDARTQDERWEGGRLAVAPRAFLVAARNLGRLRFARAAGALELASPPLTLVGGSAVAGLILALFGAGSRWLGVSAVVALGAYVALGLAAARPDRDDLSALAFVPRFVVHKLMVFARLTRGRPRTWERTTR